MKNKNNNGSTNIKIIIAILAFVILGLAGFIIWQNFFQSGKKSTETVVSTKSSDDNSSAKVLKKSDSSTTKIQLENALQITQWGVEGSYTGSYPVSYSIGTSYQTGTPKLEFTSSSLSGGCSGAVAGTIKRYTGNVTMDKVALNGSSSQTIAQAYAQDDISSNYGGHKKVGDYYYVYESPLQGCYKSDSDSSPDATFTKVSEDVNAFFKTLQSI